MPSTQPLSEDWRSWPVAQKQAYLQRIEERLPNRQAGSGHPLTGASLSWQEWLRQNFPHVCNRPFGERHLRLWDWFEALQFGTRPLPRIEVWPRGGAKSTTTELGCTRACVKLSRRYALYVSETQDQADKHVAAIASLLESAGVERSLNKYGSSRGWRRQELRTANGFNVSALGLDTGSRGVKLDQYRPDLIIFDDVDHQHDTEATVQKKLDTITTAIIPAGSIDCAYLFVQNQVHEDSIVSMLVDGRADFLHDREPAYVEPAVRGLKAEPVDRGDGLKVYRITEGEPTWAGQDLATCEFQINAWGLTAFLREAQHEVGGGGGYFFNVEKLQYIERSAIPSGLRLCRAWDVAATEGGGDLSSGVLMGVLGRYPHVRVIVLNVKRGQWGAERVDQEIEETAASDPPGTILRLPQDPGQAGKAQAVRWGKQFQQYHPRILPVNGNKAVRARGFAGAVNLGNVELVRDATWNHAYREVLRKFKEDLSALVDDDVDASSDAFNELVPPVTHRPLTGARRPIPAGMRLPG
jgi:predicted phage terminase large subunit-like protein